MAPVKSLGHQDGMPTAIHGVRSYNPSIHDTHRFWSSQDDTTSRSEVPQGFPARLDTPMVWQGSEMEQQSNAWIVSLSEGDVKALEDAMHIFRSIGKELSKISPLTFPLPDKLAKRLEDVSEQCYNGRGFCVVRGLEPAKYTDEENVIIYTGISAHIGSQRGFLDRARKNVLCHVFPAASGAEQEKSVTPGFTNGAMSFHTDDGDILALYAVNANQSGGRTLIASGWQVFADYNKWPPIKTPLLFTNGEKVIFNFSRYPLHGFRGLQRNPSLLLPTSAQSEALDAVHFFAQKNALALPTKTGDIVYLNNMAILHAREPFEDQSTRDLASRRHLMKLQIRDPGRTWRLPPNLTSLWQHLFAFNREDGERDENFIVTPDRDHYRGWAKNG